MDTPQEIEVWYVLPAIRRELAKEMLKNKLKQKQIADLLGITEPAVSQYLKNKRAKDIKFSTKVMNRIKESAKVIEKDKEKAMEEIQLLCRLIRDSHDLCNIHKEKCNCVPSGCCICLKK